MGIGIIGFAGWLGVVARIVGWVALGFFSLRPDGFQMFGIRNSKLIPWSQVRTFTAMAIPNPVLDVLPKWARGPGAPKMVFFDYLPGVQAHERLRSLNRTLTGHEAGLADTYGLKAEELATLMNDWRSRFAAS